MDGRPHLRRQVSVYPAQEAEPDEANEGQLQHRIGHDKAGQGKRDNIGHMAREKGGDACLKQFLALARDQEHIPGKAQEEPTQNGHAIGTHQRTAEKRLQHKHDRGQGFENPLRLALPGHLGPEQANDGEGTAKRRPIEG